MSNKTTRVEMVKEMKQKTDIVKNGKVWYKSDRWREEERRETMIHWKIVDIMKEIQDNADVLSN